MATMTVCAICGGIRAAADANVKGKRCTCSASPSTVMVSESRHASSAGENGNGAAVTTATAKTCSVCHVDVTDKKRMKDSASGKYWCYDCYVAQQRKSGGMTMRCPHCSKDFPPTRMVRHVTKHGDEYWCDTCDAEQNKGKKKKPEKAAAEPSAPDGSKKLYIAGAVMALIAAAYWFFALR